MSETSVPSLNRFSLLVIFLSSVAASPTWADEAEASTDATAEECQPKAPEKPKKKARPALVSVDEAQIMESAQTIPLIGRVVSKEAGPVASQVAGPVKSVLVNVGDRVKKGDVLSELDGEAQRAVFALREAEVAQSAADVASRQTTVGLAESELKRAQKLRAKRVISESDYTTRVQTLAKAKADLAQAEAGVMRARVSLAIANRGLKEIMLRAPYDGVVSMKHTSPGAWVNAGSPVVSLINDESLELEADVPSSRLAALTIGVKVKAEAAGKPLSSTIRAIVPNENPASKTRMVRFTLTEKLDAALAQNQSVIVNIPSVETKPVVTVHKDAIIHSAYGPLVFIVDDNNVAQMSMVQLGEPIGSRFVVLSGVADKAKTVTRGNERIGPNTPVKIKP